VKRVPADRWTDEPIADRVEGDTRIISVHREEVIVQRRLHVVEEVHVTLRRREERHREIVRTRQTQVVVDRDGTISGSEYQQQSVTFSGTCRHTRVINHNK
jgi:hypothetical protein